MQAETSDDVAAVKFASIMRRTWHDESSQAPDQETKMLRKALVVDVFKVLKEMATSLVQMSQPHLIASFEECMQSNMMIERA